ncbi:MAG: glutamate formimidoyltransferase [Synergistaceae bacterium]|nr:glutamate formimidoyltransferase [Synergistaceae bacterium]
MARKQYIHSAPNFSAGRDRSVVDAIVDVVRDVKGVRLIDYYPDADFDRTPVELIGEPEPLAKALVAMAGKAYELIDMRVQKGKHPRIGAQDTIPLFPLRDISVDEVKELAFKIGHEIWDEHGVPVFFAGVNARSDERREISFIRQGQYEGLKKLLEEGQGDPKVIEARAPDLGNGLLSEKSGATIVSAGERNLVAVNVILDTSDLEAAKRIAKMVRGPSGGFSTIRAVAFKPDGYEQAAVSMNMFNTDDTPLYRVVELIRAEARSVGISVKGVQMSGVFPTKVLLQCAGYYLNLLDFQEHQLLEHNMLLLEGE